MIKEEFVTGKKVKPIMKLKERKEQMILEDL
jgi:hypothetical protein